MFWCGARGCAPPNGAQLRAVPANASLCGTLQLDRPPRKGSIPCPGWFCLLTVGHGGAGVGAPAL